ncbi:FAD synthase [Yarrowia sp. B02]|nr:FAD synthase [Yarrowia sp. B02]
MFSQTCKKFAGVVDSFLASEGGSLRRKTQEQVRESLKVLQDALHRYELNEISLSYNGGKDCQVMVILLLAALWKQYESSPEALDALGAFKSVYVASEKAFEEVDAFVDESCKEYGLQQIRLSEPMKEAFESFLDSNPTVKAIIVGIRRSDPYGQQLTPFDPTDKGWPAFMRVHPVLEWKYVNIWDFLLGSKTPYCMLYDQGYTSLGGTDTTVPNPKLRVEGSNCKFRPAYELVNDDEERLGRFRK